MHGATGLQFYCMYVIAKQKVGEQHIQTKYCKCNIFQITIDLLNSEYLKVAIAMSYMSAILLCYS